VACPSARHVAFLPTQKRRTVRYGAGEHLGARLILSLRLGHRLFLGDILIRT
jgi:hypothetical protein